MSYYHSSVFLRRVYSTDVLKTRVTTSDVIVFNGNDTDVIELKNPDIDDTTICNQHETKFFEFNFMCPDIFKSQEKQYALLSAMQACPSGWQPTGEPRLIEGSTWGIVIHRWNKIL
jgi:uncharacterized protein YbdZ (MbtH family)